MSELPLGPLPGSPVPMTVMPSVLEADAKHSALLGELADFSQNAKPGRHELWPIALAAGWIRPDGQDGPTLRLWEPVDPDLTPPQALMPWLEVYRALLTESPALIDTLLIAFRDGTVTAPAAPLLERLGAVTVEDGVLRLTALGVRGLFTRGRWADPQYWLLDPGEWWATLPPEDLVAFLTAASKLCLVDQAKTVQRWFEQADPLEFAYQLVMVADRVGGAVLNTVFGYLLRIGLDAAPAVEEWLVVEDLSGFGWRWFDAIGAPMAGIPSERAQYLVKSAMVQSLDDFRALLDRYAECPPEPPLPGATIDELIFSLPLRIRTDRVNELVHSLLTTDPSPDDRAELDLIVAEARREFLR